MTCKKWVGGWHQWNLLHDEVEHTYRINHIENENLMMLMKLHLRMENQSNLCIGHVFNQFNHL